MNELQHKYDVLLATFVGAIMAHTGCTQDQAATRIATLCAITQTQVFDPVGPTVQAANNKATAQTNGLAVR